VDSHFKAGVIERIFNSAIIIVISVVMGIGLSIVVGVSLVHKPHHDDGYIVAQSHGQLQRCFLRCHKGGK